MSYTLSEFGKAAVDADAETRSDPQSIITHVPNANDTASISTSLSSDDDLRLYLAALLPADLVDRPSIDDYILLDHMGEGGMGVVFRAYHRHMEREVALKLLPAWALASPENVRRFRREVKAAARLFHPNIVTALDAREYRGHHYLVTELVDGPNLCDYVASLGPMSVEQAVKATIDAARGLAHAHERGVVHRDVKPGNMLLAPDGTVKVLDLGLARLDSESMPGANPELTATGIVMGTSDYIAPEQAANMKDADARADIYSLGCTLCYLLTGKPIYGHSSSFEKIHAHIYDPIPSLAERRSDVPKRLQAIFERMVAKNREDRYQTMSDLLADLECVLTGGAALKMSVAASPSKTAKLAGKSQTTWYRGLAECLLPWSTLGEERRHRATPGLVAGLGALLAITFAGANSIPVVGNHQSARRPLSNETRVEPSLPQPSAGAWAMPTQSSARVWSQVAGEEDRDGHPSPGRLVMVPTGGEHGARHANLARGLRPFRGGREGT
ncbi:Serine/threonine-protein kinase PrkC [Planctomycetes bacterium Pan216]|uniref:Serine/threonine-protein kinase PrkC n=1 Tax=Kolteria novifilia TaxID=2527975 RepID=A0A518B9I8_9BACT|nr:Serine/threonine-protein kinase PrkC [Planctomycetes bacterium Pan216]